MSTYFYLVPAETSQEELHDPHFDLDVFPCIGKSTSGWAFMLSVYDDGPKNLGDWLARIYEPGQKVVNDGGRVIIKSQMVEWIVDRSTPEPSYEPEHLRTPQGLRRPSIGSGACIGHGANGAGSWVLMTAGGF